MRTHNIPSCYRKSKRYLFFAFGSIAMINTHSLELPYLELIVMVPKVFEPLKFDCILVGQTGPSVVCCLVVRSSADGFALLRHYSCFV